MGNEKRKKYRNINSMLQLRSTAVALATTDAIYDTMPLQLLAYSSTSSHDAGTWLHAMESVVCMLSHARARR